MVCKYRTNLDIENQMVANMWEYCPKCRCIEFIREQIGGKFTITCIKCGNNKIIYAFPYLPISQDSSD